MGVTKVVDEAAEFDELSILLSPARHEAPTSDSGPCSCFSCSLSASVSGDSIFLLSFFYVSSIENRSGIFFIVFLCGRKRKVCRFIMEIIKVLQINLKSISIIRIDIRVENTLEGSFLGVFERKS